MEKLYDFPADLDGSAQTIGIVELGGGFKDSDLNSYFLQSKLPRPVVVSVGLSGATNKPSGPNGADGQVQLDIEVCGSVAPKAQLVVYFAPSTNMGYLDAINAALNDSTHHPSVLLIDWGTAESMWTASMIQAVNDALGAAARAGITVVAASGDNGATDGVTDGRLHVDFPSSSPWVLSVGGTKLIAKGDSIVSEIAWNDSQTHSGATGGGVSDIFPQPEWQSGITVPSAAAGKKGRWTPDVAADASPETGYKVMIDGQWSVIGGTSASAPLWAGLIALLNQGLGHEVGDLHPVLYGNLGLKGGFHAITIGGNGSYSAGPGWNPVAGWGTPDGKKLLAALKTAGK